jgi:homoserine kinase type II
MWILDDAYVLRVYRNLDGPRVGAEHRLLEAFAAARPPFAVPTAIATRTGETWIPTAGGPASLYSLLPGRPGTAADLHILGETLAELMIALASIPHTLAPVDWRTPLGALHHAVPDVGDLVAELERVAPGAPGLDVLAATWQAVDASYLQMDLPCQICHLDFAPGNVLIEDGRAVAVLDFEVAGLDFRVGDLVAGLVQSTDTPAEHDAFLSAYRSRLELSDAEWAAVPTLRALRRIGTVVWRAGRWREGKATLREVLDRVAAVGSEQS